MKKKRIIPECPLGPDDRIRVFNDGGTCNVLRVVEVRFRHSMRRGVYPTPLITFRSQKTTKLLKPMTWARVNGMVEKGVAILIVNQRPQVDRVTWLMWCADTTTYYAANGRSVSLPYPKFARLSLGQANRLGFAHLESNAPRSTNFYKK